jgi:hypothetical protein
VLAYARSFWIQLQLQTKGTTNERFLITLDDLSLSSYLTFVTPLIFLHHTTLFLIEMSSIDMLGYTMLRIVASTIFTTFLLLIIQLFSKR